VVRFDQEGVDISMLGARRKEALSLAPDAAGKYRYTVYAFLDLKADDETYVNGKPRGTLDLTTQRFRSLQCFVIGVTMFALIFPRTNAVTVSEQDIREGIPNLQIEEIQSWMRIATGPLQSASSSSSLPATSMARWR
jgi:hypothetical protein